MFITLNKKKKSFKLSKESKNIYQYESKYDVLLSHL